MTCPICQGDSTVGSHGACIERFLIIMRTELQRLRLENARLAEQLQDAGILRKEFA